MKRRGAFFCLLFIAGFLSFFTRKDATPTGRNQAGFKNLFTNFCGTMTPGGAGFGLIHSTRQRG